MTTTQTPKQTRPTAPKPSGTVTAVRASLTGLAVIMVIAGAFWLAFNIGTGQQVLAALGMLFAGLTLMVISQRSFLYDWIDEGKQDRATGKAAQQDALPKVPKPRRRRDRAARQQYQIPHSKPDLALGVEFRYIVLFGRYLAENAPDAFEVMAEYWDTIDWASETTDSDYREAVDFLWDLARQRPDWDEKITQKQMLDGKVSPANPFAFVAEAESYHPMIAAMAVLMLVRGDNRVTREDFDVVIEPWTERRFPYRLADMVFSADATGQYKAEEAPPARRPVAPPVVDPRTNTFRPDGDLATALAAEQARSVTPPAQTPPETTPPAAEPVTSEVARKHAEPERDDVPEPETEQVLLAAELVITSQFGSTQMIMRKMRIGFSLGCKIMHLLQVYGVVSRPPADNGPRDVMVPVDELAETIDFIREQEAERTGS